MLISYIHMWISTFKEFVNVEMSNFMFKGSRCAHFFVSLMTLYLKTHCLSTLMLLNDYLKLFSSAVGRILFQPQ